MLFTGCTLLGIPILIPINLVGGVGLAGLLNMTIGNVGQSWRLWFHLILTYVFCGKSASDFPLKVEKKKKWVAKTTDIHILLPFSTTGAAMALLWWEMREYTQRRHAYLMSARHNKTPQSTTILVTAIPKGLNTEEALFDIFNRFPGGVSKIWLNRYATLVHRGALSF